MVSISALHARVQVSRPEPGTDRFSVKADDRMITLMSIPSYLIGDVKEPLRITCIQAVNHVTALSAST